MKEPGAFLRAAIENQGEQAARLLADTEPVAAAANRLQGVRRLFIAGTGTSYHGAMVGEHLFRAAGYEAWAVPAFEFSQYPPALRPGDGLIVLSHRGTKRFSMGALQHVSGLADRWIAITGQGSPLTGAGVVQTVPQERSSVHTVSHVGALVRLAQLATHASPDLHSAWAEAMEGLPARVQSVLEDSRDPIAAQAEQIRFDRGTFFIGGGPATATALEGALKLREASFVFAEGHEVEAVLHGPLISIDAADRAVMIAEPGPSLARTQDVAAGLSAIGVPFAAVGSAAAALDAAGWTFATPPLPEPLAPILNVIPLQWLAYFVSRRRGVDADLFRADNPSYAAAHARYEL
ncbi:MAG: SIS domain-containing protein [Chloroflexi bacterium]|nr:MAG: SIS domain-containing protein [Chloroflexota bacterium]